MGRGRDGWEGEIGLDLDIGPGAAELLVTPLLHRAMDRPLLAGYQSSPVQRQWVSCRSAGQRVSYRSAGQL